MAKELTWKVRLISKNDTLEAWQSSSLVLKKGEIAVAYVPTVAESPALHQKVLIKIGDGQTVFSSLPYLTALAEDVPAWAKAEEKPTYTAEEIEGIEKYIQGHVQDNNTVYRFKIENGDKDELVVEKKDVTEEDYSEVARLELPKYDDSTLIEKIDGKQDKLNFVTAYDPATNRVATEKDIEAVKESLSKAMHWKGVVDVQPSPETGAEYDDGDVVSYNNVEYVWTEAKNQWDELGNEASYHTHENMDVLNQITSQKVSDWDSKADGEHTHTFEDITQDEGTELIFDCGSAIDAQ